MSVPLSAAVTLGLLFFLSVGLNEQVAEGCTCVQRHPQRVFCESDIVIRAKILGSVASTRPNLLAYSIKVITTFKPSNKKDTRVIYSSKTSCGARPENGEYLLSGHVVDGVMVFGLCELVWRWDQLSVQKRNLNMYQSGCVCEITSCTEASCLTKNLQRKCLVGVKNSIGLGYEEALRAVCLPGRHGSCRWQK
ncbi:metalloproteinase inhibitor 3-like isoform X2 [Carassius carassius]|uniref:metalloproteinase inhibitor 3-like isoform X2 n=1 Tax=Carassius carassius TaxID=217509 RepID=UPI002868DDA4|nr:metalloproteinase inhibitor 3-like isoform X2 [Carassius carassius]